MQTGIVQPSGPSNHFWINFGSVWARYTASGGAVKRLVTITWVSPSVFSVILLIAFLLACVFPSPPKLRPAGRSLSQGLFAALRAIGPPLQSRFCEPTRALRTLDSANDESRIFEHLQVLGDCGLRHLERLCQFIDGGLPLGKARQNRPTRRVGQSRESSI